MEQDNRIFLERANHAEIAASGKIEIDLNGVRANWGDDLNTLMVTNTDAASAINIYLDGVNVAYATANNGTFNFDWEFGKKYNFLAIENTNAGAVIAAGNVKITIGRSGGQK